MKKLSIFLATTIMLFFTTVPTAAYAAEVNSQNSIDEDVCTLNSRFVTDSQTSEFQSILQDSLTSYKDKPQVEKQAEIQQLANQIEWIFTNAIVRDISGSITAIDFNKVESYYGDTAVNSKGYQILKEVVAQFDQSNVNPSTNGIMPRSFLSCMEDNIKDLIGGTAFAAIAKGAWAKLIEEQAWKEVAELIVEVAGSEFTVGALAISLVYFAARCI